MEPKIPLDQPPWRCIAAYKERDYARCVEEAKRSLAGAIKPVEMFLLLIALRRLGRQQEAEQLAQSFSDALRDIPFEQTLVQVIMGRVKWQQAAASATNTKELWQAVFYGGACALTDGRLDDAREANNKYLALVSGGDFPECYEFLLAPPEFEQFLPPRTKPVDAKPWWKLW